MRDRMDEHVFDADVPALFSVLTFGKGVDTSTRGLAMFPANVGQELDANGCHCFVCLRRCDRLGGIDVKPLTPAVKVNPCKLFVFLL